MLDALIAIAGWLVWRRVGWHTARVPYGAQLVLNAGGRRIFFRRRRVRVGARGHRRHAAGHRAATVVAFWPISRLAAALLVPYLLWVAYATALNAAIWSAAG